MLAFTQDFYTFVGGIGFTLGAVATGLWIMLGVYWWKNRTNATRTALVSMAVLIVVGTGFRVFIQLQSYESEVFGWEEWLRTAINVGWVALGIFMFRHQIGAKDQDFRGSDG